jgi:hypothetical protein
MRPVRPAQPSQRAKRQVQNVSRQDRNRFPLMSDGVDFQAQPRRLIGTGVHSHAGHGRLHNTADQLQGRHESTISHNHPALLCRVKERLAFEIHLRAALFIQPARHLGCIKDAPIETVRGGRARLRR